MCERESAEPQYLRKMQIFVDLGCLGIVTAHVHPHQTFGHLKSRISRSSETAKQGLPEDFYFSYGGKAVSDSCLIAAHGVQDCSTLQLWVRAYGGGGDGGATGAESRDCYLNMYAVKKPDKVDPNEARIAKWSRCALSSEVLKPPCVVDLLGNLYNKEALVSALLTKSLPKELRYIKGLKDMVTIHLTSVPGVNADDDISSTKFECPISGQELNGKYKFYALRGCGHVLSAKALKELQSCACLVCSLPFVEADKIIINGTEEEVLALRQIMEQEGAKLKEKKEKKATRNGQSHNLNDTSTDSGLIKARVACKGDMIVAKAEDKTLAARQEEEFVGNIKRKGYNMEKIVQTEKPEDQKSVHSSKRFKAVDNLPLNATKEVYASIFSSSGKPNFKETYMCRSLPLGRN